MRKIAYASAISLLLVGCNVAEPKEDIDVEAPLEVPTQPEVSIIDRPATKDIVQSIEGQEVTTPMELVEGSDARYSLYVDKELYTFETARDKDLLTTRDAAPDSYPETTLQFLFIKSKKPEALVNDLKMEYMIAMEEQRVTSPVDAISLHGTAGNEPTSEVVTLYLLEMEMGTLLITEKCFLEAQEGHGARFEQMLATLELNE